MDNYYEKFARRGKRQLYEDGTDMSLQQLEDWNALDAKIAPRRGVLDQLMDEKKPFHETIMPGPDPNPNAPPQPKQVAPFPKPPAPQLLRSVLIP
jgi:hypothetical protein